MKTTVVFASVLLSVVAVTLTACGGTSSNVTPPPPVANISVSPTSGASGASVTITYSCANATSATASGGWSDILSLNGAITKNPTATTTYILTCSGAGGSATAPATYTVIAPPSPTITANPGIITSGQSTVITWNAGSTATSDSVSGPDLTTSTALTGSATVSPATTSTYTISATNAGGTTPASVTVTVNAPAPTATLTYTPTTVAQGSSTTCTITTTNATQVIASSTDGSWSGSVTLNGTAVVTPKIVPTGASATVSYSVTATGSGGSVTTSPVTITVTSTAIQLTSVNNPVTYCVGQCGFLTLTFTGANLAAGQVPSCTPNSNILSAQVISSTQVSITFGIDQVHEGSGWRSCKICKGDGTGCSGTVAFGLYSQNMCAEAPSGEMFCLNPQETVAGQSANGYVDKFKPDGTPDGKFLVGSPTCCIAVDNVTGYVLVDKTVYAEDGVSARPYFQGFQPEPVVANIAENGWICVLQPTAPNNLTCSNITGPATSWPLPVASTNVGTNPQSLAIVVNGGKTYVDVLTSSTPTLWSVDTSTMATITSQPVTDVTANLPGGSAISTFDSLGTGLITSFVDKVAIPFSETTLKQGNAITLPGVPVSATSTANGIAVIGNADQPNAGGTLTEVNPTSGAVTLVPSVETSVLPVGTVPASTGKGFFVCPQDGVSSCSSFTLP